MDPFEREWRARFEKFARGHSEEHLVSGWSPQGLLRRVSAVGRLVQDRLRGGPLRILDLGCGAGTYVRLFAGLGHRVVGLDYSMPSLRRAREADPRGFGSYVEGEAYHLPFRSESFDAVVGIGIFQALGSAEQAIDQILRVLRPGGWTLIETLNAASPVSVARRALDGLHGRSDPVRTYSPLRVRKWLAARGARPVRQAGVYLPPPRLPVVGAVLDRTPLPAILDAIPGAPLVAAHAILTLARKRG
jgi:SAM-dependent methyltransferase